MDPKRVLQPYVCCLGNPVAGNPTQFIMYRAARESGVDWRFFTSQVSVDQFEVAFRGVQALGLDGAAILPPFQSAAIPLLESVTESALCLGQVNVARSDNNSWLGENTLGTAIAECIDSHRQRHPFDGQVTVLDSPKISKIIRLASPQLFGELVSLGERTEPTQPTDAISETAPATSIADAATPPVEPDSIETIEDFAGRNGRLGFLVVSEPPTMAELKRLANVTVSESSACLLIGKWSEKQSRPFRDWLTNKNITMIKPVELMAHQAAADFHFWTGVVPSVEVMRDSLEEYLQW